ncbi:MAG: putative zinc-binding metallopeptidase [Terriglobales bacterium]
MARATPPSPAAAAPNSIWRRRICDLGLRIEGSPLAPAVGRLYRELAARGLQRFQPLCYLTDEWGCPSGEPVIGIPFYLADRRLARCEQACNDLEDGREILMYLRHEAGHAFNYAYRLYRRPEWRRRFGPYRRPYRDHYRPVAFSREYVRHIAGWYAQKHPDEDFAETFAVWLTPRSRWREKYRHWPALAKLEYVERLAAEVGARAPLRRRGRADLTVREMKMTVGDFYRAVLAERPAALADPAMDADLTDIFPALRGSRGHRPAAQLVRENRKALTDKAAYWTGVRRPAVKQLVEAIEHRLRALELRALRRREPEHLTELAAFVTAMAMQALSPPPAAAPAPPSAPGRRVAGRGAKPARRIRPEGSAA